MPQATAAVSAPSAGRQTSRFGDQPQRLAACSTLWWVGPSSPRPIAVVGEDVDHAAVHQRRHPDRVAAVVAEKVRKVPPYGHVAAVQRDAVHDRGHAEFAHPVVDVPARPAVVAEQRRAAGAEAQRRRASWYWSGSTRSGRPLPPSISGSAFVKTSSASWLDLRAGQRSRPCRARRAMVIEDGVREVFRAARRFMRRWKLGGQIRERRLVSRHKRVEPGGFDCAAPPAARASHALYA